VSTVTVSYPAAGLSRLLLPKWVARIETEARTDGKDEITVVATQRFEREQWLALPLQTVPDTLAVGVLLGQGRKSVTEDRVRVVVQLPPARMDAIRVQALQPDA
jgi:hypothetical protein